MHKSLKFLSVILLILLISNPSTALRLEGSWKRSTNWDYFTRFCFHKSSQSYGNISWIIETKKPLVLSFYDDQKGSWDSITNKDSCTLKNNKAKTNRNVYNKVLSYEKFSDIKESHMWYFSLSDCNSDSITIENMQVHIWNPMSSKWRQEFSCDQQGILALEVVFFIFFLIITFVQIFLSVKLHRMKEFHTIFRFFLYLIILRTGGLLMSLVHFGSFAQNGIGSSGLFVFGSVIDIISEIGLYLLLVLLAFGWTITLKVIPYKKTLFSGSLIILLIYVILIIAAYTVIDYGTQYITFEAVPGILLLIFRIFICILFCVCIIKSYSKAKETEQKTFFKKVGIFYGLWFILVPIFVFISFAIPDLYREIFTTSCILIFDFLAYAFMIYLLWPTLSKLKKLGFTTEEAQELKSGSDWAALADEVESSSTPSSNSEEDEKL
ncbi:intimal thickness receptor-related [Anaeramoeba flamelloides]|uniref:Intimal thickness receptor-related n=1 Tax=Anaeramoeba flamelloides TaxID=1746091 RepID=A0AAV7ZV05_9EUKA|nr:intimal thickness receptor-related [Anaeramoeba flamelloides]